MKTTNYDLFSFYMENRKISKGNIKQKIKSIQNIGYIESLPIIVDENFRIIDGQHRFLALKELNMPIVYAIEQIDYSKAMVELNRSQEVWRLQEYIFHHATRGAKDHIIIKNMLEKYPRIGTTAVFSCFGVMSATHSKAIKSGAALNINPIGENIIKYLISFSELPHYARREFVNAIYYSYNNLSAEMLNKLHKKRMQIPILTSRQAYLICFENILNYGLGSNNRISLNIK